MSAVAELTHALISTGMDPADAAALVARAGAEMAAPTRSKGAIRTERWRAKRASQTVTERHAVTPEAEAESPSPTVTDRHKASHGDGAHISLKEEDSEKEESKREGAQRRRASRLPDDWQPTANDIAYAIAKGLAEDRIPAVAEKFKNHWIAKSRNATSTNWHRNWCTWVMNEIEWYGGQNGHRVGGDRTAAASSRQQSDSDAVLAGVAAAAERRARARRAEGSCHGSASASRGAAESDAPELFGAHDG